MADRGDIQQRIDELFAQASELQPEEQESFLDEACQHDSPEVRRDVERMLRADAATSLQPVPFPGFQQGAKVAPNDPLIDRKVGKYVLRRLLGQGGFGTVYLAERTDEYQQKVAVKLIRSDRITDERIIQRFEFERQTLADLHHENIAQLLDGGVTEDGWPYFVMEYVQGEPITDYCDQKRMSVEDRLVLFQKVCAAVKSAHDLGYIHRDIKPSNILVTIEGVPKLLDFGLAKVIDPRSRNRLISITEEGIPLTREYASPEQIRGDRKEMSTGSDVYSLGVVLYELLTGHPPYDFTSYMVIEMERVICEEEPQKPSTVVLKPLKKGIAGDCETITAEQLSLLRKSDPKRLCMTLRGDLETILLAALHKDRSRRYDSPASFAEDIDNYLTGLPVQPRRDSLVYRAKKFVKRNQVAVIATLLIAISVLAGGVASTALWLHNRALAHNLELKLRSSKASLWANQAGQCVDSDINLSLLLASTAVKYSPGFPAKGDPDAEQSLRYALDAVRNFPIPGAENPSLAIWVQKDGKKFALAEVSQVSFGVIDPTPRVVYSKRLWDFPLENWRHAGPRRNGTGLGFSPNGRWYAMHPPTSQQLIVWDLHSQGESIVPWKPPDLGKEIRFWFSDDDKWLLTQETLAQTTGDTSSPRLRVWDMSAPANDRRPITLSSGRGGGFTAVDAVFSKEPLSIIAVGAGVLKWNAPFGRDKPEVIEEPQKHTLFSHVAVSPQSDRLAYARTKIEVEKEVSKSSIHVLELSSLKTTDTLATPNPHTFIVEICLDLTGRWLATRGSRLLDDHVFLWDLTAESEEPGRLHTLSDVVEGRLLFDLRSKTLASLGPNSVQTWDLTARDIPSAVERFSAQPPGNPPNTVAAPYLSFDNLIVSGANGTHVRTTSKSMVVCEPRVWNFERQPPGPGLRFVNALTATDYGKTIAVNCNVLPMQENRDGVFVQKLRTDGSLATPMQLDGSDNIAFGWLSEEGAKYIGCQQDGSLLEWDLKYGSGGQPIKRAGSVNAWQEQDLKEGRPTHLGPHDKIVGNGNKCLVWNKHLLRLYRLQKDGKVEMEATIRPSGELLQCEMDNQGEWIVTLHRSPDSVQVRRLDNLSVPLIQPAQFTSHQSTAREHRAEKSDDTSNIAVPTLPDVEHSLRPNSLNSTNEVDEPDSYEFAIPSSNSWIAAAGCGESSWVSIWYLSPNASLSPAISPNCLSSDISCIAASPSGGKLAAGTTDGSLIIWQCDRGWSARPIVASAHRKKVNAVAFIDEDRVATISLDWYCKMWHLDETAGLIAIQLPTYPQPPWAAYGDDYLFPPRVIALRNAGLLLGTFGIDQKVHVWRTDVRDLCDIASRNAQRDFSPEELRYFRIPN